jgi:uncharacterized SAM-binding protein YcdF (DUF218 family)
LEAAGAAGVQAAGIRQLAIRQLLAGLQLIGMAAFLALLALSFTPVADGLSRWLSKAPHHLERTDAIVVLGSGVRENGSLTDSSLRRALHGIDLYRHGLSKTIIFTGPRNATGFAEGEVRATLAREMGIPPAAILTDTTARTTHEEAERVAALLRTRGMSRILLVVDPEGVRRAARLFERHGLEVAPSPAADVSTSDGAPGGRLRLTRQILIELLALAYYHAAGYL